MIDNPHFRELLLYLGQGHVTDDEIPRRTSLTASIIEAWKAEREEFYQEMKVRQIYQLCYRSITNRMKFHRSL